MRSHLLLLVAAIACQRDPMRDGAAVPGATTSPMASVDQPPRFTPLDPARRIHRSDQSAGGEAGVRVLRTREAWEAAWAREVHEPPTAPAAPVIDFTRDEVVVVFLGPVSSGGYDVEVLGVAAGPGGVHQLRVRRTRPAPGCMTTAVMGAPVDVIRLPRSTGTPIVVWETRETPCS
jgi:hypothetical protein